MFRKKLLILNPTPKVPMDPRLELTLEPVGDTTNIGIDESVATSVTIENTGNVTLYNIHGSSMLTSNYFNLNSLDPGQSYTANTNWSYTITESDILDGSGYIDVTVTADTPDPDYPEITLYDSVNYSCESINSSISINVTPDNTSYSNGQQIVSYFELCNDGNVTISNISLSCATSGSTWTIEQLIPGSTRSLSTSYTVTYEDSHNSNSVAMQFSLSGYSNDSNNPNYSTTESYNYTVTPCYTLTINYLYYDTNDQAYNTYSNTYNSGESYNITSPLIIGYTADINRVSGTITEDTTINVVYTQNKYILTINYSYMDGRTAAPTYTGEHVYNEAYSITSPVIEGYIASYPIVSGNMPAGDHTAPTVFYRPTQTTPVIDDPDTPV